MVVAFAVLSYFEHYLQRRQLTDLCEPKRQGGWERWEMVERYSDAVPMADRSKLPNPQALHNAAFGQPLLARRLNSERRAFRPAVAA